MAMRATSLMDHGKFCSCTHTERSHGAEGCQVYRFTDVRGRVHRCRCPLTPEQVRRNDDHFDLVVASVAESRALARAGASFS